MQNGSNFSSDPFPAAPFSGGARLTAEPEPVKRAAPTAHAAAESAAPVIVTKPVDTTSLAFAAAATLSGIDFGSLGLVPALLNTLANEGYSTPTPIQAKAIPIILAGRDVLGCAQTGTGKTAAFALPIIQRLMAHPDAAMKPTADDIMPEHASGRSRSKANGNNRLPRVLVLAPTRELAQQIADSFGTYGRGTGLRHTVIYGGVSQFHQVKALQTGVDIVVATPGRLMDLMQQRHVDLRNVTTFILDEADRMLDMGFIQPIQQIAGMLPAGRQTLLFSATMPKEVQHLADSLLNKPEKLATSRVSSAATTVEQRLYHVDKDTKQALLRYLCESDAVSRAVVFTKTKHAADRVAKRLERAGISVEAIHGDRNQNQRIRALAKLKSGEVKVLVATDVAARGLDVDAVSHVINYELPLDPEAYVHRIGRTGRAGMTGIAISMCGSEERGLLRAIEKLTGKQIPVVRELPNLSETIAAEKQANAEAKRRFEEHGGEDPSGRSDRGDRGGRGDRGDRGSRGNFGRDSRGSNRNTDRSQERSFGNRDRAGANHEFGAKPAFVAPTTGFGSDFTPTRKPSGPAHPFRKPAQPGTFRREEQAGSPAFNNSAPASNANADPASMERRVMREGFDVAAQDRPARPAFNKPFGGPRGSQSHSGGQHSHGNNDQHGHQNPNNMPVRGNGYYGDQGAPAGQQGQGGFGQQRPASGAKPAFGSKPAFGQRPPFGGTPRSDGAPQFSGGKFGKPKFTGGGSSFNNGGSGGGGNRFNGPGNSSGGGQGGFGGPNKFNGPSRGRKSY